MKLKYNLALLAVIFILGCNNSKPNKSASNSNEEDEDTIAADEVPPSQKRTDDEAIYKAVDSAEDFHKIVNARYQFSFHIPKTWRAFDKSGNGDGFFVEIPNSDSVDVRVFGEQINPALEDFYWESCEKLEEYTFTESLKGKRCIDKNEMTYSLKKNEERIIIYVKNHDDLPIHEKVNFTSMLKSLRINSGSERSPT